MISRISSAQVYQGGLNAILDAQVALSRTQNQLATGKRVLSPADDPAAASQIIKVRSELDRVATLQQNAARAEGTLAFEESALTGVESVLQRARELAIQGNAGSLSATDRGAIANEIDNLAEQLLAVANTQNADGEYIFAGNRSKSPAFEVVSGLAQYQGDSNSRAVNIAAGIRVSVNDTGDNIFIASSAGNGRFEVSAASTNVGAGFVKTTSADNSFDSSQDYSINFTTTAAGQLQYSVTGSVGGNIVPVTNYVPDEVISIPPGGSVLIEGTPAAGDRFDLASGGNQSAFATLAELSAALRLGNGQGATAQRTTALNQSLQNLDQNLTQVSTVRTDVGARMNRVSDQIDLNSAFNFQLEKSISELEDLDYASAITELNLQLVALEAAQQTYVKTQGLSLFNYL